MPYWNSALSSPKPQQCSPERIWFGSKNLRSSSAFSDCLLEITDLAPAAGARSGCVDANALTIVRSARKSRAHVQPCGLCVGWRWIFGVWQAVVWRFWKRDAMCCLL